MEREEAEKERKKEEEERRKRKEEAKRRSRILEAAFDGDNDEILAVLDEVIKIHLCGCSFSMILRNLDPRFLNNNGF